MIHLIKIYFEALQNIYFDLQHILFMIVQFDSESASMCAQTDVLRAGGRSALAAGERAARGERLQQHVLGLGGALSLKLSTVINVNL